MNRSASINREILRLAIPNILTNVSVPLLSSVDTALMGHVSGAHLGAVGLGSMIFNFLYWNFSFLRMGTVGVTAQAYGAGDSSRMIHSVARALLLAGALSGVLLIFKLPIRQLMIYLMQVQPGIKPLVARYFDIRIWAAPASLGLYALFGFFFGMQNVIYPLVLTIFINVINILLSYYLVQFAGMGVAGVAWGTVIAQYAGLLLAILFLIKKYRYLFPHFKKRTLFLLAPMKAFFQINRDLFIRTLALTTTFFFFYSESARMGAVALAANVVLLQFLNWMSYGVDGFAYASESLVGKYKGANNPSMVHQAVRYSFVWGMGLALLYSLIYGLLGDELLRIFTDQEDVIAYAQQLMFWVVILPVIGTPSYIWDGVFIGATASREMRDTMLAAFVLFLAVYYFSGVDGAHRLWLALLVFLAARGLGQWWMWRRIET